MQLQPIWLIVVLFPKARHSTYFSTGDQYDNDLSIGSYIHNTKNTLTSHNLHIDNFIGLTVLKSAILGMPLRYSSVNIKNV